MNTLLGYLRAKNFWGDRDEHPAAPSLLKYNLDQASQPIFDTDDLQKA